MKTKLTINKTVKESIALFNKKHKKKKLKLITNQNKYTQMNLGMI